MMFPVVYYWQSNLFLSFEWSPSVIAAGCNLSYEKPINRENRKKKPQEEEGSLYQD